MRGEKNRVNRAPSGPNASRNRNRESSHENDFYKTALINFTVPECIIVCKCICCTSFIRTRTILELCELNHCLNNRIRFHPTFGLRIHRSLYSKLIKTDIDCRVFVLFHLFDLSEQDLSFLRAECRVTDFVQSRIFYATRQNVP